MDLVKVPFKTIQPLRKPIDWKRCKPINFKHKKPIEAIAALFEVGEEISQEEVLDLIRPQNKPKLELLGANHEVWGIVGHWLAALRAGLTTTKYPFNLQEYRDRETFARVLLSQWSLCEVIFELAKEKLLYSDGTQWFIACVREIRRWQLRHILYESDRHNQILKSAKVLGIRDCIKQLEQGENLLTPDNLQTQHHYLLFEKALALSKRLKDLKEARTSDGPRREFHSDKLERRDLNDQFEPAWNLYLRLYKSYATDIQEGDLQAVKVLGNRLVHMDGAHPHPEPLFLGSSYDSDLEKKPEA